MPLPIPSPRRVGRPRLEDEYGVPYRAIVEQARALKQRHPRLTWRRIAIFYLRLPPYTLYRYLRRYRAVEERQGIA